MSTTMSLFSTYSTICILVLQWVFLPPAAAQTTEAVCTNSTYSWTFNSRGQSPCVVASYLLGGCSGTPWDLKAGGPGIYYAAPTLDTANLCQCSSVVYDLISACSLCQSGNIILWATWTGNCTSQYVRPQGTWSLPIPPGTSVPGWAYVTPDKMGGFFNPPVAKSFDNATESTATPTPTGSASPTGTGSSNAPPASKNNHVGAIVGGVLGGLAAIVILILSVFFYRRRQRRLEAEKAEKAAQQERDAAQAAAFRESAASPRKADEEIIF